MPKKELGHEKDETFVARISLTKTEKSLVERFARRFRGERGVQKPSVGKAIASLVRTALHCIMYHDEQAAEKAKHIGPKTLERMKEMHGVNIVTKRSLQKPKTGTQGLDGKIRWDDWDEDELPGNQA